MPNAAARFDDDFEAPARPKPPRRPAASRSTGKRRKKGRFGRFGLRLDMVPVARYGAIAMSGAIAIGILVNALMMQKGRHPAPLFGKSIALGQSAAAPRSAAPAPTPKAAATPASTPVETPRVVAKAAPEADEAPSNSDDAIGRLLTGGSGPVATERPNTKTVLGVQHALAKLGFSVKQTGTFGPQTRKAIERFERDHHLAVKGEMSKRVVKLLASESHIKIEQ